MKTNFLKARSKNSAFTLIELLVVISIIGILIALSLFGIQGARQSSRDSKRKADLELIRSGLEIYKSDCNKYPSPSSNAVPSPLKGDDSSVSCSSSNVYIQAVPKDPLDPITSYYYSATTNTYLICAFLEQSPNPPQDTSGCGSCGKTCNYKVTNP